MSKLALFGLCTVLLAAPKPKVLDEETPDDIELSASQQEYDELSRLLEPLGDNPNDMMWPEVMWHMAKWRVLLTGLLAGGMYGVFEKTWLKVRHTYDKHNHRLITLILTHIMKFLGDCLVQTGDTQYEKELASLQHNMLKLPYVGLWLGLVSRAFGQAMRVKAEMSDQQWLIATRLTSVKHPFSLIPRSTTMFALPALLYAIMRQLASGPGIWENGIWSHDVAKLVSVLGTMIAAHIQGPWLFGPGAAFLPNEYRALVWVAAFSTFYIYDMLAHCFGEGVSGEARKAYDRMQKLEEELEEAVSPIKINELEEGAEDDTEEA